MNYSPPEDTLSANDVDFPERKRTVPKCRIARVLSRHPSQRHCPTRKVISKRKKRRFYSVTGTVCSF